MEEPVRVCGVWRVELINKIQCQKIAGNVGNIIFVFENTNNLSSYGMPTLSIRKAKWRATSLR